MFSQNSSDPPLPPGESEIAPPQPDHGGDNLETVAMEDEPLDATLPEQEIAVTRLDYNHGQPVPLPEVAPPPSIPGMQTFDHNHGFTPAAGAPTPAYVPAQRFDYGHQSANYEHQKASHPPSPQWYDYNHMHGSEQQQHYEADRHHSRHSSNRTEVPQSHVPPMLDYGSMSGEISVPIIISSEEAMAFIIVYPVLQPTGKNNLKLVSCYVLLAGATLNPLCPTGNHAYKLPKSQGVLALSIIRYMAH
jgi:hypothetical protein